jgi:anti-sigma factor RsiW
MMNCHQFENLIWSYLEGNCNEQERHEMEAHAGECAHCRQALASAKATFAHLRSLPKYDAPTDLAAKMRDRLQQTPAPNSKPDGWLQKLSEWGRRANLRWAIAPALGTILIGILWMQQVKIPSQQTHHNLQPVVNRTLADEYADACLRIHEQVTASEMNGDPTTDYLLMSARTTN